MQEVQFILPGVFDIFYSFGAWWILGYASYFSLLASCMAILTGYTSFVSFFFSDFAYAYREGANFCNQAVRPLW
jgi:hypothetical protein